MPLIGSSNRSSASGGNQLPGSRWIEWLANPAYCVQDKEERTASLALHLVMNVVSISIEYQLLLEIYAGVILLAISSDMHC